MLCGEEGCTDEARFSYIWPWGAQGVCCGAHRLTLHQRATQQLNRGPLQFTVLDPGRVEPLTLNERSNFRARIYTLEEELSEKNRSILALNKGQDDLAQESVRLRNIVTRLEHELAEAVATRDRAIQERDRARAESGAAIDEQKRLQMLVKTMSQQVPSEMGAA